MGVVLTATCRRRENRYGVSGRDELDQFLISLDPPWPGTRFEPVGSDWSEISRKDAVGFVQEVTNYNLAYGDRGKALSVGWVEPNEFVAHFSEHARYFTNGWDASWRSLASYTCGGGSTASFNAGLGIVDVDDLGILWVQDED